MVRRADPRCHKTRGYNDMAGVFRQIRTINNASWGTLYLPPFWQKAGYPNSVTGLLGSAIPRVTG